MMEYDLEFGGVMDNSMAEGENGWGESAPGGEILWVSTIRLRYQEG